MSPRHRQYPGPIARRLDAWADPLGAGPIISRSLELPSASMPSRCCERDSHHVPYSRWSSFHRPTEVRPRPRTDVMIAMLESGMPRSRPCPCQPRCGSSAPHSSHSAARFDVARRRRLARMACHPLEQPPERETDHAAIGIEESRLIDLRCCPAAIVNSLVSIEQVAHRQRNTRAARPLFTHKALLQIGEQP